MLEMLKARKEALQERGVKGFTLMEMLIVIAIIAVLIAIAIPILSGQLENAKEATDAANIRSAYAVASVEALEQNANITAGPVKLTQGEENWTSSVKDEKIGGIEVSSIPSSGDVYVHVAANGTISINGTESGGAGTWTVVDPVTGQAPSASTD